MFSTKVQLNLKTDASRPRLRSRVEKSRSLELTGQSVEQNQYVPGSRGHLEAVRLKAEETAYVWVFFCTLIQGIQ